MNRHPDGLATLFLTEAWERFSYYGMRALLVLFLTAPRANGGLEFDLKRATTIYGLYTSSVYITAPLGGFLADRFLGATRAVILGGLLILVGQILLTTLSWPPFCAGMGAIAIGSGLLKPNVSALVGSLYDSADPRRDAGFSLFYMGINLGATLAPLVCGALAQGLNSWRLGFAAAGLGMAIGLVGFVRRRGRFAATSRSARDVEITTDAGTDPAFARPSRAGVILAFCAACVIFFTVFEQSGSSLTLFADRRTRHSLFGVAFPSSWFQSVNAVFILMLAPAFSSLWNAWGPRAPRSPWKFSIGLLLAGLGYVLLLPAASASAGGLVSPLWLIGLYLLHTLGELCLSPVGLATMSKLAPARHTGRILGLWLISIAIGNYLAGVCAGAFDPDQPHTGFVLFASLAALSIFGSIAMALSARTIVRRMGDVH